MSFKSNKISSLVSGLVLISLINAHVVESRVVEWDRRTTVDVPEEKKDTGKRTSIVLNWISVCQDLCSLNLSGTGCGVCDVSSSRPFQQLSNNNTVMYQFCEILCENGLGGVHCNNCTSRSVVTDFNAVCTFAMCHLDDFSLNGCSACTNTVGIAYETEITTSSAQTRSSTSTTPDWIGLCVVFCSQGQGGSACNCDKLPLRLAHVHK